MPNKDRQPDVQSTSDKSGGGNDSDQLSAVQITAATGASTTAAVVATALGVYGTVIGVAVISVITSVATVLYLKSMNRTKQHLGRVVKGRNTGQAPRNATEASRDTATVAPDTTHAPPPTPTAQPAATPEPPRPSRGGWLTKRNWRTMVLTSVAVFALSVGVLTALALMMGKPATSYYDSNPPTSTQQPGDTDEPTDEENPDSPTSPTEDGTPSQPSEESPTPGESTDPSEPATPSPRDDGTTGSQQR